ncbi:uncharacterized protein ACIBXB_018449 isoform 1-T2 [Morphnus guianensis]
MGHEWSHLSRFSTKSGSGFLPAAGERGFRQSCQSLPRSHGGERESCSTDAMPAAGASGTREKMNKLLGVAVVVITSGPTRGEHISRCYLAIQIEASGEEGVQPHGVQHGVTWSINLPELKSFFQALDWAALNLQGKMRRDQPMCMDEDSRTGKVTAAIGT